MTHRFAHSFCTSFLAWTADKTTLCLARVFLISQRSCVSKQATGDKQQRDGDPQSKGTSVKLARDTFSRGVTREVAESSYFRTKPLQHMEGCKTDTEDAPKCQPGLTGSFNNVITPLNAFLICVSGPKTSFSLLLAFLKQMLPKALGSLWVNTRCMYSWTGRVNDNGALLGRVAVLLMLARLASRSSMFASTQSKRNKAASVWTCSQLDFGVNAGTSCQDKSVEPT